MTPHVLHANWAILAAHNVRVNKQLVSLHTADTSARIHSKVIMGKRWNIIGKEHCIESKDCVSLPVPPTVGNINFPAPTPHNNL